jgi:glycolate oxidase iron-sulfur subunit
MTANHGSHAPSATEEIAPAPNPASAFDAHHPPETKLLDACVHCGFCLQACPTYLLWGEEMDSPRGRIQLIRMASEGATAITPRWVEHFDACLGCMACMTACPSGVDYSKLIEATRAQIERVHHRSFADRWHRRFIFSVFTKPERLRLLGKLLAVYQKSGLQSLLRSSGLLEILPPRLAAMEALAPKATRREATPKITPAIGEKRARVGLLLGCAQREFLSQVNAATARVLAAEGCEVVAPPEQSCCGALMIHAGEESAAAELARQIIEVFERAGVDTVVINAAGCGSSMKEYGHLLRDDAHYAERARAFAARCMDVTEFLAKLGPRATRHPLPLRVAYQDACHLQHAQGVRSQPRSLLGAIPGVSVVEAPEAAVCCGSAGIYNLVQPEAATALGDRKAELIAAMDPDVVATCNPGCLLQMTAAFARTAKKIPVVHTIQLLDASLRGEQPQSFQAPDREAR